MMEDIKAATAQTKNF